MQTQFVNNTVAGATLVSGWGVPACSCWSPCCAFTHACSSAGGSGFRRQFRQFRAACALPIHAHARLTVASVRMQGNSGNSSALSAIKWLIIGWVLLRGCAAAPGLVGSLPLAWLMHSRVGQGPRPHATRAHPGC